MFKSFNGARVRRQLSRAVTVLTIAVSSVTMLAVTMDDAEARRMGGGKSFGRQSSNVMQKRAPVRTPQATPNATRNAQQAQANRNATASRNQAGATQQRSGFSRFLGPIAGIAAGLGIAALLSSLGLSGALLEILSSLVLIGLVVLAVVFLVRLLRGGARPQPIGGAAGGTASGAAYGSHHARQAQQPESTEATHEPHQTPCTTDGFGAVASSETSAQNNQWFIPDDFDTGTFLTVAKEQFRRIQGLWDEADIEGLKQWLTDDLLAELTPQITHQAGRQRTEIVLLNAEMLGLEQVAGGHLASVRFSGMLREEADQEAQRFEEVWNLYKTADSGWLLAGIQQIPSDYRS